VLVKSFFRLTPVKNFLWKKMTRILEYWLKVLTRLTTFFQLAWKWKTSIRPTNSKPMQVEQLQLDQLDQRFYSNSKWIQCTERMSPLQLSKSSTKDKSQRMTSQALRAATSLQRHRFNFKKRKRSTIKLWDP
jgi:hypothetical protein